MGNYEAFLQVAAKMGIEVDVNEGMTRDEYVMMNTKPFSELPTEQLATRIPEVLEALQDTLDSLSSESVGEDAADASELRRRVAPAATVTNEENKDMPDKAKEAAKPKFNAMGGTQLDEATECRIMMALVVLWIAIFVGL